MIGGELEAADALSRVVPGLEAVAAAEWEMMVNREAAVRALVMIRDGLPAMNATKRPSALDRAWSAAAAAHKQGTDTPPADTMTPA